MKYFYKTAFGTFWIVPAPQGGYNLTIHDETVNWAHCAEALADDVFTCHSGFDDWDEQDCVEQPTDLTEWTKSK